jgi:hypothetical protein
VIDTNPEKRDTPPPLPTSYRIIVIIIIIYVLLLLFHFICFLFLFSVIIISFFIIFFVISKIAIGSGSRYFGESILLSSRDANLEPFFEITKIILRGNNLLVKECSSEELSDIKE